MMQLTATRSQRVLTFFLAFVPLPASAVAICLLQPSAPLFVKAMTVGMIPLCAYGYGTLVTRLTVLPDGTLVTSSLFRQSVLNVREISKIDIRQWNRGMAFLKTSRGTLIFYRDMPGLLDTLRRMAADNPGIKLRI